MPYDLSYMGSLNINSPLLRTKLIDLGGCQRQRVGGGGRSGWIIFVFV